MNPLWLLVLLPALGAAATATLPAPWRLAIARATALITALLALLALFSHGDGGPGLTAASAAPLLPARGASWSLTADPLAIPGVLTVTWITALAAARSGPRGREAGGERGLALLLLGEAAALLAWLAADLGALVGTWGLLAGIAALLVRRDRPAVFAVFLPLAAAAAALTFAALLLGLSHQEATLGWSFATAELLGIALPGDREAVIAGCVTAAGLLFAGIWPLDGWWRRALAATATTPAVTVWLLAVLPPLGIGLLVRVALPAAPAAIVALAPALGILGGLTFTLGLLGAAAARRDRSHLHLARLPAAAALIGVVSLTAEGLSGALLLGLAGGLAFALAHLADDRLPESAEARPSPADKLPISAIPRGNLSLLGSLSLLGLPGLFGFAATFPLALATLLHGHWTLGEPLALALGLLLLAGGALGIAGTSAAAFGRPRPTAPAPVAGRRRRGSLLAAAAALIILGLAPAAVHRPVYDAAPGAIEAIHHRWCLALVSPAERPRVAATVTAPACEPAIAGVHRALRADRAAPKTHEEPPAPDLAPPSSDAPKLPPEPAPDAPLTPRRRP